MGYAFYEIPRPDQAPGQTMKRGYGVTGRCRMNGCKAVIDRGFSYLCYCCTWYFCPAHLRMSFQTEYECFAGSSGQICVNCKKSEKEEKCSTKQK